MRRAGETHAYSIDQITMAIRVVAAGFHFIATNPDKSGPSEHGIVPACGAMASLIKQAAGRRPLFIGKPNPLMMRLALNYLGVHSESTIMIGDNMETDIIAGVQSGLGTILVLSGITTREHLREYPYQPTQVLDSVADIVLQGLLFYAEFPRFRSRTPACHKTRAADTGERSVWSPAPFPLRERSSKHYPKYRRSIFLEV